VLTAPITAAITAILALFGVKLSLAQIGMVAIAVKVVIVLAALALGGKLLKRRQAGAEKKQPDPGAPG
jgi:hypothetical protein